MSVVYRPNSSNQHGQITSSKNLQEITSNNSRKPHKNKSTISFCQPTDCFCQNFITTYRSDYCSADLSPPSCKCNKKLTSQEADLYKQERAICLCDQKKSEPKCYNKNCRISSCNKDCGNNTPAESEKIICCTNLLGYSEINNCLNNNNNNNNNSGNSFDLNNLPISLENSICFCHKEGSTETTSTVNKASSTRKQKQQSCPAVVENRGTSNSSNKSCDCHKNKLTVNSNNLSDKNYIDVNGCPCFIVKKIVLKDRNNKLAENKQIETSKNNNKEIQVIESCFCDGSDTSEGRLKSLWEIKRLKGLQNVLKKEKQHKYKCRSTVLNAKEFPASFKAGENKNCCCKTNRLYGK